LRSKAIAMNRPKKNRDSDDRLTLDLCLRFGLKAVSASGLLSGFWKTGVQEMEWASPPTWLLGRLQSIKGKTDDLLTKKRKGGNLGSGSLRLAKKGIAAEGVKSRHADQ